MDKHENEFFDGQNLSKSEIIPNDEFDKAQLEEQHGIERPFSSSENSIQVQQDKEASQQSTTIPIEFEQCPNCGRKFFLGRLQLHQKTCTRQHPLKPKLLGGEQQKEQAKEPTPKKKRKKKLELLEFGVETGSKLPRWKMEHFQLVQNIQYSRELEKAVRNGANIKELQIKAPRNPFEEDYVLCTFCQRKFAPYVAERHIPRCKNIFNRPPPPKAHNSSDMGKKQPVKALEKYSQYVGSSINEEVEELDNEMHNQSTSQAHKTSQTLNQKSFKESTSLIETRMSQSQQQSSNGNSAFLPRLQQSPQNQLLSRSTPMVQCPSCLRSFDERASQRHIPICEKANAITKGSRYPSIKQNKSKEGRQSREKVLPKTTPEERQFCTNCGSKFAHEHKFCGICGKKRE